MKRICAFTVSFLAALPWTVGIAAAQPVQLTLALSVPSVVHVGDSVVSRLALRLTVGTVSDVVVSETDCAHAPTFVSGDANSNGELDSGETWLFSCTRVVSSGDPDPLSFAASATAVFHGRALIASAHDSADVIHPALQLHVTANPTSGTVGDEVTFSYLLSNAGDAPIFGVKLVDNQFGQIWSASKLAPGDHASISRRVTLSNVVGTYFHSAKLSGTDETGRATSATSSAGVTVVLPKHLYEIGPSTRVLPVLIASTGDHSSDLTRTAVLFLMLGIVLIVVGRRDEEPTKDRSF